jgi:hypothetical protein
MQLFSRHTFYTCKKKKKKKKKKKDGRKKGRKKGSTSLIFECNSCEVIVSLSLLFNTAWNMFSGAFTFESST